MLLNGQHVADLCQRIFDAGWNQAQGFGQKYTDLPDELFSQGISMTNARQTTGAILICNTMAYDRGHAAEFKLAVIDAVEYASKNAPQLMVQVYLDEENALCYSFQLFQNSEAILHHWKISDPNISEVMKYCVIQSMEVYGHPNEAVRNGILGSVGKAGVSFTPELSGFHRFGRREVR